MRKTRKIKQIKGKLSGLTQGGCSQAQFAQLTVTPIVVLRRIWASGNTVYVNPQLTELLTQ